MLFAKRSNQIFTESKNKSDTKIEQTLYIHDVWIVFCCLPNDVKTLLYGGYGVLNCFAMVFWVVFSR